MKSSLAIFLSWFTGDISVTKKAWGDTAARGVGGGADQDTEWVMVAL
jgi:hypothetical protein